MKKVQVVVKYGQGKSSIQVPTEAIGTFVANLVLEARKISRRKDRARSVTVLI